MKKRVKLITTIASLCLAVALMAFGVYAGSLTASVSGSINYTATGVDGDWTWTATTNVGTFAGTGETTITSAQYAALDAGAKATALHIELATNADVTITVDGSFTTASGTSNGATVAVAETS